MPMPKPKDGEKHDDFMHRCMANPVMNDEYPETNQRFAVCESLWKDSKKEIEAMRRKLFSGTRIWTCDPEARELILKGPAAIEGTMVQHARIADSVSIIKEKGKEKPRSRRFRITTESMDRHGDVVRTRGVQLRNFRKNPVVLFAHNASEPPIGTASKLEKGDGTMDADVDFFDKETFEFADTIYKIVKAGGLKATSIGFMPMEFDRLKDNDGTALQGIDFKKSDLLEFSIVPIPANPEAVGLAVKDGAAMRPYIKYLESLQDDWEHNQFLMKDLGIGEDEFNAARKAASNERTSWSLGGFVSPAQQDDLLAANLKAIKGDSEEEEEAEEPQPIILSTSEDGVTTFDGEPPEFALFNPDAAAETTGIKLSVENDEFTIEVDNGVVTYSIESSDGDGTYACRRTSFEPNEPEAADNEPEVVELEAEAEENEDVARIQKLFGAQHGFDKEEEPESQDSVVQEVAGRKSNWGNMAAFLSWAEGRGFKTDSIVTTKNFWRLRQRDMEDFEEGSFRNVFLDAEGESSSNKDCKVQTTLGTLKESHDTVTNPVTALASIVREFAADHDLEVDEDAITAAEEYVKGPTGHMATVAKMTIDVSVSAMCMQHRIMQVMNGEFGKDLPEDHAARLMESATFFINEKGAEALVADIDAGDLENEGVDALDNDMAKFARSYHDVTTGTTKVRELNSDTAEEAEETVRRFVEVSEDPDLVVFVGRAVGQIDGDELFQDEAVFRWVPNKGVIRLGLGKQVSDPLEHLDTLSKALGDEDRTFTDDEEAKLSDVVALLSTILDSIADSKSTGEEDFDDDDVLLSFTSGDDTDADPETKEQEADKEPDTTKMENDPIEEASDDEVAELFDDILSEEAPEAAVAALGSELSNAADKLD